MPRVPTRDLAEHIAARGAVLTTVLITMIPLVMLITAATMVMTGRNDALLRSVQGNKAHWAAASAIEEAGQLAQEGLLATNTIVAGDLGGGVTYQYEAAHLGSDGWDNDGDGLVDEGDERSYEVVAVGAHGVERRRLSALIIEPATVGGIGAAILTLGTPEIETNGGGEVTGVDTLINGGPGPGASVLGIATEPPHTGAELLANYTNNGSVGSVTGTGSTPSIGAVTTQYNLGGILTLARNLADNLVEPGTQTGLRLGDARRGDWQISYCPGDLSLSGSNFGAGLLVVTGDFANTGSFRWDGLVVVLGNIDIAGNSLINGAMIQGPEGQYVVVSGTSTVRYSTEALANLGANLPQIYFIEGWRESGL